LRERVQQLEAMLERQRGTAPSAGKLWPSPRNEVLAQDRAVEADNPNPQQVASGNPATMDRIEEPRQSLSPSTGNTSSHHMGACRKNSSSSPLTDSMSEGPSKHTVERLISASAQLMFDRSSGRVRFFGPVTAFHHYLEKGPEHNIYGRAREQRRRVESVLKNLLPETHDHLMDGFWTHYCPILQVVDKAVFLRDKELGEGQSYGGVLHICLLAIGFKYADMTRPDIQRLALPGRESILHKEAKYLMEFEMEEARVPSLYALLILSELEAGCGRDTAGWMYAGTYCSPVPPPLRVSAQRRYIAGMAFRLAFDLGLDLDCSALNLSSSERQARHHALQKCIAYDKSVNTHVTLGSSKGA